MSFNVKLKNNVLVISYPKENYIYFSSTGIEKSNNKAIGQLENKDYIKDYSSSRLQHIYEITLSDTTKNIVS